MYGSKEERVVHKSLNSATLLIQRHLRRLPMQPMDLFLNIQTGVLHDTVALALSC
jgi:hypothetical protein